MSSNWENTTLGEVLTLQRGMDLPVQDRQIGKFPVVASTGVVGYHTEAPVKGPGVVIGRSGSIGGGQYINQDFWPLNTTLWVKDFKGNDPRYCYYLLKAIDFSSMNAGSGVPTLNRNHLHPMRVYRAPIKAQKYIANLLGYMDDSISLLHRTNTTLESIAKALFQSWFVDFDPVRAKLDGSQPAGIDEPTANLFPDTFQDSELGNIPKGWTIKPVGEVVDCVGGGTPSTAELKYWEGGTHHWTTPKDFSSLQSPILLNTDRKLTDAGIAKISSGLLPAGTLLLSSRAPVGYLAIASMPVAINQGFIALKCNEYASNYFMLNWCQSNMPEIESRATGTTFAEISKQNFRPIRVVLPSKNLMSAFTAKVEPLYEQITANLRQSQTLASLRDTLLPKLLSGELSVENLQP
jgi:type I restriction enzyme S subunit